MAEGPGFRLCQRSGLLAAGTPGREPGSVMAITGQQSFPVLLLDPVGRHPAVCDHQDHCREQYASFLSFAREEKRRPRTGRAGRWGGGGPGWSAAAFPADPGSSAGCALSLFEIAAPAE